MMWKSLSLSVFIYIYIYIYILYNIVPHSIPPKLKCVHKFIQRPDIKPTTDPLSIKFNKVDTKLGK